MVADAFWPVVVVAAVAGPRVPRGLYRAWIWAQALLLGADLRPLAAMMGERPVSFFAPHEHGLEVRYALHMTSDQRAVELARELAR